VNQNNIKRILQVLLSITLLGILVYWINLDHLVQIVLQANVFLLVLALVVTTFNRILMPVKWNLLLRVKQIHLSWYEVTKIYYMSTFLGIFLPPTIGVDAVKTYQVSKRGGPISEVVSSILIERLLGMIALSIFAVIGATIFVTRWSHIDFAMNGLLPILVILAIVGSSVFVMSLSQRFSGMVLRFIKQYEHTKYVSKLSKKCEGLYNSYQLYSRNKGTLVVFFVLTCLENVLPIIRPYIIAIAFDVYVPFLYLCAIVPLELILIRLPISFEGFGIREGIFVYFLGLIGFSADMAFSIGLTNHLIFLIAVLPGLLFYVLDGKVKEAEARLVRTSA